MTQQERLDILSREILRIEDIQILFDVGYQKATEIIRAIRSTHDRLKLLKLPGVVHVQDYLEYFNIPVDRYIVTVVAERDKNDKIQFYKKEVI